MVQTQMHMLLPDTDALDQGCRLVECHYGGMAEVRLGGGGGGGEILMAWNVQVPTLAR